MTYLITGGGGFIGSHLAEAFLLRGEHVRILDNWSTGRRQNLTNLQRFISSKQLEVWDGDVRDRGVLQRSLSGVRAVFHQAAVASVPRSVANPLESHEVNCTGTLNVLLGCREQGVKRVVYAGSCAAYGDTTELPIKEETLPAPLSPYAVSKLTGEYYCRMFSRIFGLETVILRYFNVFGPFQDPSGGYAAAIPRFITALLGGEQPCIYGDGRQSRDFVYVANVVEANLLACGADAAVGGVFNIGTGHETNLLDLLAILEDVAGRRVSPLFAPPRAGDIVRSYGDITRARAALDYRPRITLAEGLRETVMWYRETGASFWNRQLGAEHGVIESTTLTNNQGLQ